MIFLNGRELLLCKLFQRHICVQHIKGWRDTQINMIFEYDIWQSNKFDVNMRSKLSVFFGFFVPVAAGIARFKNHLYEMWTFFLNVENYFLNLQLYSIFSHTLKTSCHASASAIFTVGTLLCAESPKSELCTPLVSR